MAKCEEGYLCEICGGDVEQLRDSHLYLRFVIGWVDPETLHLQRERHIQCDPALAQYIVDEGFPTVTIDSPFDKRRLDAESVAERETLLSRGWLRLVELESLDLPIVEYPLPEFRHKFAD